MLNLKNKVLERVVYLATGLAAANLIPIIILPVLTRLYTPEDFGYYSQFISIINFLIVLSCCSLDKAINISENKIEAKQLVFLIFKIAATVCSAIFLLLSLLTLINFPTFKIDLLSAICFPLGVFFLSLFNSLYNFGLYLSEAKSLAKAKLINVLLMSLFSVFLGFFVSEGMVYGFVLSYFFGFFILIKQFNISFPSRTSNPFNLLKKYRDFPLYSAPHELLSTIISMIPVVVIYHYFSKEDAGYFGVAMRMILPMSLISQALSQVMLPEMNRVKSHLELKKKAVYILKSMSLAGILIITPLFFFSEELFTLFLGAQYTISGYYFTLLSPMLFARMIGSVLSNILVIVRKQKIGFILEFVNFFVVSSVFFLGIIKKLAVDDVLLLYAILGSIVTVIKICVYFYFITSYKVKQHEI